MNATVTRLNPTPKPKQPKPAKAPSRSAKIKGTRQRAASYAIGSVGLVLTGLSLSHLASGVQVLTHSEAWSAWSMAAGIDLGFIGLEVGQLCCSTDKLRQTVERFARPAIIGTLIASALMNAYAFASEATSWPYAAAGCALGVAIPAMVYVLTRVSMAMFMDGQR